MITDITFGQYFPSSSVIHKLDPRIKFIILIAVIVFIFLSSNFIALGVTLALTLSVIVLSKIPLKLYLKNIKVILPILIFTMLINIFYIDEGKVLFDKWIFTVTTEGIYRAVFMALRIILLIIFSSILTYTTTPNELTDAMERLCLPLKFIGLGTVVHMFTMMMTIALRFIPTLIEETQKIMNAQKARGANLDQGGFLRRVKAIIPILIPLIILSVRRAYELAEAMECRCYNGGIGKKKMKQLHLKLWDLFAILIIVIYAAIIIFIRTLI